MQTYDEFPVPEFRETEKVYPQWTGRRDKAGLPVYVFKISGLTKEAIDEYNKEPERLTPRMVALYEVRCALLCLPWELTVSSTTQHMVQFALPFCSSCPRNHEETPVSATTTSAYIGKALQVVPLTASFASRRYLQRFLESLLGIKVGLCSCS